MMDTQLPETCREVEINILRSGVHLLASCETDYTAMHDQQNVKKNIKYNYVKFYVLLTVHL